MPNTNIMINYKKIVLSAVFLATLGVLFVLAGQPVEAERQGGRTVNITANNSVGPVITVPSGSLVKLEWTATEKKSKGCTISADPYNESVRGIVSTQGALTLNVYTSATYTIGCYYYNPNVIVSDSITVNVSTQPSITVISPNGGEVWQAGQTYQIQIACSEGISKTINIILLDYRAPAYGDYTKSFLFTGLTCRPGAVSNYYWTIPTSLYGNNVFKVVVETYDGSINDFSDNYFSIVAPK